MQIDWFTVVAQIINFVVLVLLLRRFLYGPIIRAMDAREAKIRERLDEAARVRAEAEEAREHYRRQLREVEERREEMMAQVEQDVRQRRQELIVEAREGVETLHRRWLHGLQREREAFAHELRQRLAEQAIMVARQALRELAGEELEERMVEVFAAHGRDEP